MNPEFYDNFIFTKLKRNFALASEFLFIIKCISFLSFDEFLVLVRDIWPSSQNYLLLIDEMLVILSAFQIASTLAMRASLRLPLGFS